MATSKPSLGCASRLSLGAFLLCMLLTVQSTVEAQVTVVELPEVMHDFAIDPSTAAIASVNSKANRAYLFRATALRGKKATASASVRLGDKPSAICYKQFGDATVFAAVCVGDSHMYVIDASKFTLIKKIALPSERVLGVVGSSSSKDPFIYYNYQGANGGMAGVVDLRKMVDRGYVFDADGCAISASGTIAYRRDSWSSDDLDSLQMSGSFSDEKPRFVRLFHLDRSEAPSVPDQIGQYTASGDHVYTSGLKKKVATLKFKPECFLRTKPVLIGIAGTGRHRELVESSEVTLTAVSSNTFSSVGSKVKLPKSVTGIAPEPRDERNQLDLPRIDRNRLTPSRRHVIADEKNSRVIYAYRDKIALIPLADFKLPDEPFLTLSVSHKTLMVGAKQEIQIKAPNGQIQISYDDLPAGVTKTSSGLSWTPANAQVGVNKIPVTLAFKEIQRVVDLEFNVTRPHKQAPFVIQGFAIDDASSRIVCWSSASRDENGRPLRGPFERPFDAPDDAGRSRASTSHLAIMPLRGSGATVTTKLSYRVKQAIVAGPHVFVLPNQQISRVEVYQLSDMKRVKTLLGSSQVQIMTATDKRLQLHGLGSVDIYELPTFRRRASHQLTTAAAQRRYRALPSLLKDGLLLDGVLRDADGEKAKLILAPGKLPELPGADERLFFGPFLRKQTSRATRRRERPHPESGDGIMVIDGPARIPGTDRSVALEFASRYRELPGGNDAAQWDRAVSLAITDKSGARQQRVMILRESIPEAIVRDEAESRPKMHVAHGKVFVVYGDKIYPWSPEGIKIAAPGEQTEVEFYIAARQSKLAVPPTGETVLKHEILGGKKPHQLIWMTRTDGITMDESTGNVKIDGAKVAKAAEEMLVVRFASRGRRAATPKSTAKALGDLRTFVVSLIEPATKILGRKPTGIPVAIPIHLRAVDENQRAAEIQYFVVMELPYRQLTSKIQQRLKSAEEQQSAENSKTAKPPANGSPESSQDLAGEVARLRKRVESLEAKIDVLTRYLAKMAKEQEKK